MAVTTWCYGPFAKSLVLGRIDFLNDEFKAMVVGSAYVANQDTHEFKSSINNEVVSSGYAPGGQVVQGIGVNYVGSTNILTVTASNLVWPAVTFSARRIIVYNNSWPTEGSKPLVLCVDFGANVSPAGQSFYYNWPGGVMFKMQVPVP